MLHMVLSKYIMAYLYLYHITADTADGMRASYGRLQWLVCGVWRQCGVHPGSPIPHPESTYEYVVERGAWSASE